MFAVIYIDPAIARKAIMSLFDGLVLKSLYIKSVQLLIVFV